MTILSSIRKVLFISDGQTNHFAFGFKVFQPDEIGVAIARPNCEEQRLIYITDYTVQLNTDNQSAGGTVILSQPLAAGSTIAIFSKSDYVQPVEFNSSQPISASMLNTVLDRNTIQIQQLQEQSQRSMTLPITMDSTYICTDLPAPEADMLIGWNHSADKLVNKAGLRHQKEYWTVAVANIIDIRDGTKQKLTLHQDTRLTFNLDDGDDLTLLLNPAQFKAEFPSVVWFGSALSLQADTLHTVVLSKDQDIIYGWWQVAV
ncbi:hypothetical protein PT286_05220 [Neisseriaceae bacterium ESL0693]|nr:hypothetical protein [Neisseriaceae bacterium ESL0693]